MTLNLKRKLVFSLYKTQKQKLQLSLKRIKLMLVFMVLLYVNSAIKKVSLIVLLKINKNLKISFYYSILFFDLTINLKLKSSKKFLFNF